MFFFFPAAWIPWIVIGFLIALPVVPISHGNDLAIGIAFWVGAIGSAILWHCWLKNRDGWPN